MTDNTQHSLQDLVEARYSDAPRIDAQCAPLHKMLARGSCRAFLNTPVSQPVLDGLCAAAMASPTKSDLQQRDIVVLHSPEQRQRLAALVAGQAWVADAPMIAVFCGNNRRQRLLHSWHDVPFANDHFDAVFNAAADAAIALGAFVTAAEAVGLGCCPISAVRNEARAVSDLLDLPGHVFPFAGLAFGYPRNAPKISQRLPLNATCHVDRYRETEVQQVVQSYDARRSAAQPYGEQRFVGTFGESASYGWSEDKVRQYSQPERADFGAYIRAQGFCLD